MQMLTKFSVPCQIVHDQNEENRRRARESGEQLSNYLAARWTPMGLPSERA
jgi:hypothetical protein